MVSSDLEFIFNLCGLIKGAHVRATMDRISQIKPHSIKMNISTSSLATTEKVSQLNEEQADEKHEVQKKLDLPPEYDENDSRWTLKYREPAKGLVELMEHSGLYINAEKLAECEGLSKDSNKLAQLLLTEIFTISALSTCSWPEANANTTDIDDGHVTPRLDENATNILVKFVKEYAQLHHWELEDCHCIVKNLRQIMLQMRQKREEKTEILVLPPVYKQNDSRWTLKYREPAEGLVELMEHSGIYVNADKLAVSMKLSNDCVTLARMLLSEVFTTYALSTCSMPVVSALSTELKEQSETDNRSVLDEHAMSMLLLFAVQCGHDKNWRLEGNEQTRIQDSIRQKMEVMRRVKGKTIEERPGLVRPMVHSNVYVNAEAFNEIETSIEDSIHNKMKMEVMRRFERKTVDETHHNKAVLAPGDTSFQEVLARYFSVTHTETRDRSREDNLWTLKYRAPAEGLVELMKHSGVYVNAVKLAQYKEDSKDSVTLAQKLLTEVFNENALRTCSLSVTNNICYGLNKQFPYIEEPPIQELDAYAEIILLNFVDEYGLEQGFRVLGFLSIRKGMVKRMHEMTKEYASKRNSIKIRAPVRFTTTT